MYGISKQTNKLLCFIFLPCPGRGRACGDYEDEIESGARKAPVVRKTTGGHIHPLSRRACENLSRLAQFAEANHCINGAMFTQLPPPPIRTLALKFSDWPSPRLKAKMH